ncbi:MAG: hypothetical protein ACPIA8_07330, partial [Candidatus Puniceispirillaceae bacterium]
IFIPSFDETFFFPSNRPDDKQVQEGAAGFCSPFCLIQQDKQVRAGKNSGKLKFGLNDQSLEWKRICHKAPLVQS